MDETNTSRFVASVSPPDGVEALGRFIFWSTEALRWRKDADLARSMGVPAATLASWKRRGSVAENGKRWFREKFTETIAQHLHDLPEDATIDARLAVLELLERTNNNPLGFRQSRLATAAALGGLLSLAHFLDMVAHIPAGGQRPAEIADLLEGAMSQFRRGIRLPVQYAEEGAQ
jgi:hypothetical protein